jgi:hypothetical protein
MTRHEWAELDRRLAEIEARFALLQQHFGVADPLIGIRQQVAEFNELAERIIQPKQRKEILQ